MKRKILVLPGDGIGAEVTEQATSVLEHVGRDSGLDLELEYADIGGVSIEKHGIALLPEVLEMAREADAILLGSVGGPQWDFLPVEERAGTALLTLRRELQLFANLRPIRAFPTLGDNGPLKMDVIRDVDLVIVRELVGGTYFGEPRGVTVDSSGLRVGVNTLTYNEHEIARVARVGFELARQKGTPLVSVDKANVLETLRLWREVVTEIGNREYPDVELTHMFVDNCAMQLIRRPSQFSVIVTDNMFGDILSDAAAMISGSLGMLPSASLGPTRGNGSHRPGLYEPVHGSANDIEGKGIANPLGAILSAAMLLEHSLGRPDLARQITDAVQQVFKEGYRTADLAESGVVPVGSRDMGRLVRERIGTIQVAA